MMSEFNCCADVFVSDNYLLSCCGCSAGLLPLYVKLRGLFVIPEIELKQIID